VSASSGDVIDDVRTVNRPGEPPALAQRVRAALESGDLTAIGELLDPDVHWGAPDDDEYGCVNRRQVLQWYRRARDAGVRATVSEIVTRPGAILVGLIVSGNEAAERQGGAVPRWQVLSVAGGLITDIRGFDDREHAAARVGISG
jgi:ketosteroid isomerase-like protein